MKKVMCLLIIVLTSIKGFNQSKEDYIDNIVKQEKKYFDKGHNKYALKDYRGAISDYDKAIQLNPEHSLPYFSRGNCKVKLGDFRGGDFRL